MQSSSLTPEAFTPSAADREQTLAPGEASTEQASTSAPAHPDPCGEQVAASPAWVQLTSAEHPGPFRIDSFGPDISPFWLCGNVSDEVLPTQALHPNALEPFRNGLARLYLDELCRKPQTTTDLNDWARRVVEALDTYHRDAAAFRLIEAPKLDRKAKAFWLVLAGMGCAPYEPSTVAGVHTGTWASLFLVYGVIASVPAPVVSALPRVAANEAHTRPDALPASAPVVGVSGKVEMARARMTAYLDAARASLADPDPVYENAINSRRWTSNPKLVDAVLAARDYAAHPTQGMRAAAERAAGDRVRQRNEARDNAVASAHQRAAVSGVRPSRTVISVPGFATQPEWTFLWSDGEQYSLCVTALDALELRAPVRWFSDLEPGVVEALGLDFAEFAAAAAEGCEYEYFSSPIPVSAVQVDGELPSTTISAATRQDESASLALKRDVIADLSAEPAPARAAMGPASMLTFRTGEGAPITALMHPLSAFPSRFLNPELQRELLRAGFALRAVLGLQGTYEFVPLLRGGSTIGEGMLPPAEPVAPIAPTDVSVRAGPITAAMGAQNTESTIAAATASAASNAEQAGALGGFTIASVVTNPAAAALAVGAAALKDVPAAIGAAVEAGRSGGWREGLSTFVSHIANAALGTKITGWISSLVGTVMCEEAFRRDPSLAITLAAMFLASLTGDSTMPNNPISVQPAALQAMWSQFPKCALLRGMEALPLSPFAGTTWGTARWQRLVGGGSLATNTRARFHVTPTFTFGGVPAVQGPLLASVAEAFARSDANSLSVIWKAYQAQATATSGSFGMFINRALGSGPINVSAHVIYLRHILNAARCVVAPGEHLLSVATADGVIRLAEHTVRVLDTFASADAANTRVCWPGTPDVYQTAPNAPLDVQINTLFVSMSTFIAMANGQDVLNLGAAWARDGWDVSTAIVPVRMSYSGMPALGDFTLAHLAYPVVEIWHDCAVVENATAASANAPARSFLPHAYTTIVHGPRARVLYVCLDGTGPTTPGAQNLIVPGINGIASANMALDNPNPVAAGPIFQSMFQSRTIVNNLQSVSSMLNENYGSEGWQAAWMDAAQYTRRVNVPQFGYYEEAGVNYAFSGSARQAARVAATYGTIPGAPPMTFSEYTDPRAPLGDVTTNYGEPAQLDASLAWSATEDVLNQAPSKEAGQIIGQMNPIARVVCAAGYMIFPVTPLPAKASSLGALCAGIVETGIRMASFSARFMYACRLPDTGYVQSDTADDPAVGLGEIWPDNREASFVQRGRASEYARAIHTHMMGLVRNGASVIEVRRNTAWALFAQQASTRQPGVARMFLSQLDSLGVASIIPLHVHLYATAGAYQPADFTGDQSSLVDPKVPAKMRLSIAGTAVVAPNASHFIRSAPLARKDTWSFVALDHNDVGGPMFQWSPWQKSAACYSFITHAGMSFATPVSAGTGWANLVFLSLDPALTGETNMNRAVVINYGHHPANRSAAAHATKADGTFTQATTHVDLFLLFTDQNASLSGVQVKHIFLPPVAMQLTDGHV